MEIKNLENDILKLLNNSFNENEDDYSFLISIITFIDAYKNYAYKNQLILEPDQLNSMLSFIYSFLIEKAKKEISILFNTNGGIQELEGVKIYLQNFIEKDIFNVNKVKLIILAVIADASTSVMNEENSKGCYIATMAYGNYEHPQVIILRRYRDQVLDSYILGKFFIKTYYKYSPKLVEKLRNKENINGLIRITLNQIIKIIKK